MSTNDYRYIAKLVDCVSLIQEMRWFPLAATIERPPLVFLRMGSSCVAGVVSGDRGAFRPRETSGNL